MINMKLNANFYKTGITALVVFLHINSVLAQSDTPCGAPVLPVGTSCSLTLGDAAGATLATAAENVANATCGSYGNPLWVREDTWFAFIAPASGTVNIETFAPQPITYSDDYPYAGAAVYTGTCGSLTQMICDYDNAQNNYPEFNLTNLTPGQTYYIRFWGNSSTVKPDKTYNICVWEPAPPPANDECINAIPAAVNPDAYCNLQTAGTIEGATASSQSNWCGGTTNDDVWFSFVATNTTHYFNLNNIAGSTTDLKYQVFSGSCGSLSNATCNSGVANSLIIGNTYYVRVWSTGSVSVNSTFDLCITTPPTQPACVTNPAAGNTACTATPICNLNGYCGTTSSTYSADAWPELASQFCNATIENNSFLSFTAQATTVSFFVWVSNCNSPNGIQIMVFSAASCSSGPVTQYSCWNPGNISVAPVLVQVPGLTVGDQYYIMIDGNYGAVCDYTIGAHEGFELPVSIASVTSQTSICLGESIDLFATGGTGSYTWSPSTGLNTTVGDTVTSTPLSTGTITYSVASSIVNPLCPTTTDEFTLTIGSDVYSTYTHSACNSFTWIDGVTYTSSNNTAIFTIAGGSSTGCDSIVTLDLTVNNGTVYSTDIQSACETYTWIDGVNYTTSNNTATYTILGGSVSGCDSIITLDLTINSIAYGTDTQVACESFTWIDGINYTTSNTSATFTITGGAASGCDSIVTLYLTINNIANGVDYQTACESFTWIDGVNYTSSNSTATFTIPGGATNGCDSIVTLNLTINNNSYSSDIRFACGSFTWIDGVNYTTSNSIATYSVPGGTTNGCDSIITLNLTIGNIVFNTDLRTACDSYTWIDGITYTSNNNTATFTIVGGSVTGCDSIVTLNLTMGTSISYTDTKVACGSYTWIDGVNYTTNNNSATFTIQGNTMNICDSIISLDLTIIPNPIIDLGQDINICNESVSLTPGAGFLNYEWNNGITLPSITVMEEGNYSVYVTDINGCSGYDEIEIIDDCLFSIWVPNAFTPDGNQFNQTFFPIASGKEIENYTMFIFDRWGELIFESNNIEVGWDGTNNGYKVQDGIYIWKIVLNLESDSEKLEYVGHVNLLK